MVLSLRQAVSKTYKNVFSLQVRGFLEKKTPITKFQEQFTLSSQVLKKIQNSKLTPKGYEVIYVSPLYYQLNFGHALLGISYPVLIWYIYQCVQEPEWYKKDSEVMNASKGSMVFLGLATQFLLHWFLLRNVRVIYKKNNEYKTLIYGFLGPLRKIYIDHGRYAYETRPASKFFYSLKKRKVIIFKENFQDELDYFSLIFVQKKEDSYL